MEHCSSIQKLGANFSIFYTSIWTCLDHEGTELYLMSLLIKIHLAPILDNACLDT